MKEKRMVASILRALARGARPWPLAAMAAVSLLALVPPFGASPARAAGPSTYYVSPSGTDATCAAAQSSSTPAKTIGFAVGCANTDTTNGTATAANPDVINIAAGTYAEHLAVDAHVNLVGASGAVIDGTDSGRIITVGSGYTVGITNLTLTKGRAVSVAGGALMVPAGSTVSIANSTLSNNLVAASSGGAISNAGVLTISDSTISDNFSSFGGGGVLNSGTLTITGSTFTGNSTAFAGGALLNGGTLIVNKSTFSENPINPCSCGPTGGAVLYNVGGTATITNSTIAGNTQNLTPVSTSTGLGVIANNPFFTGTVRLRGTIIANNTTNLGGNCTGTIIDDGYNLEDTSPSTCGFSAANNSIVGKDPKLVPLDDNGGPTQTMALAPDSPAIDVIPSSNSLCSSSSTDQRGFPRPESAGSACDIGAYESENRCPTKFDFDFSGTQYADCFRDVHRGGQINAESDVGGTDHDSLVFTGLTGAGGATWLTVYDATPDTTAPGPTFGEQTICADILFARFNNLKGAGLVTLLNEGVGQKGLALIVSDAGNTDLLRLATVEGDPAKQGKFTVLEPHTVKLKNGIAENVWYRLVMIVDPAQPSVKGKVFTHTDPRNPDSPLGVQVGQTLKYKPIALPAGVSSTGQNGLLAQAVSALVDLSITNFTNKPELCLPSPP